MTLSKLETRRSTRKDLRFAVLPKEEFHSNGQGKISIMLVDDEPTFLRIAQLFLETHYGQEIEILGTAHNGEEALAQAQLLAPQLVLIDLNMPGLSGLQTIPLLRILYPEMRIIALTLNDSEKSRQAVIGAGGNDLVSKTRMGTDLIPVVRRIMADEIVNELVPA
jgi:DNA-binding NarL/FixJ family response regulator